MVVRGTGAWELPGGPGGPWRVAFEQAWLSWQAGSLGIGAALVDARIRVVATGRNRVLETGGEAPLSGTLLGHAEMTALAELGLRTARDLTLYTTVEPCLMCTSASIAMRVSRIHYAAADPVFAGLETLLGVHSYMRGRMPVRQQIETPVLGTLAALLPMASRVWSRPGSPPRREWIDAHRPLWDAAVASVPVLTVLQHDQATVEEVVQRLMPLLSPIVAPPAT